MWLYGLSLSFSYLKAIYIYIYIFLFSFFFFCSTFFYFLSLSHLLFLEIQQSQNSNIIQVFSTILDNNNNNNKSHVLYVINPLSTRYHTSNLVILKGCLWQRVMPIFFPTAHNLTKISFSPTVMHLPWSLCSWLVHIAYQYNGFSNRHASKIKGVPLVCILHIVHQNNVIIPMGMPMQRRVHPYFTFCM